MVLGVFDDKAGGRVGIAVQAAVFTGVIGADIYAGNAAAFFPLVRVFSYGKLPLAYALQPLPVNTAGVGNAQIAEVSRFSAGINRDSGILGNPGKSLQELILLLFGFCLDFQGLDAF